MFGTDHKNLESDNFQKIQVFNTHCSEILSSQSKAYSSLEKDFREALTSIIMSNNPKSSNKEFEANSLNENRLRTFAHLTERFFSTVSVKAEVGEEFISLIHETQNQISKSKLDDQSYILNKLEAACSNISLNEVFSDEAKIGNISIKNEIEKEQTKIKDSKIEQRKNDRDLNEAKAMCFSAGLMTVITGSIMTGLTLTIGFPLLVLLPVGLPLVVGGSLFIGALVNYSYIKSEQKENDDIINNSSLRLADLKLIANMCTEPGFQRFLEANKYDFTKEKLGSDDIALFKSFANQKTEFQQELKIPISSEKRNKALALKTAIEKRPELSKMGQEELGFLIEHCSKDIIQNMGLKDLVFTAFYLKPYPNLIEGKSLQELDHLIQSRTAEILEIQQMIDYNETEISVITDQSYIQKRYLTTLEELKNESPEMQNVESEAAKINVEEIGRKVDELEDSIKSLQNECITLLHKMFEAKDKEL